MYRPDVGYFIISLDTELGWGHFDQDEARARKLSADGSRERTAVHRLLSLFESYHITGTWALVGHLFFNKCMDCGYCPVLSWKGKHACFDQIYGSSHPLWYGADVVRAVLNCSRPQEIACHGFTHSLFSESVMSHQAAETDLRAWLQASRAWDVASRAVVFPRDRVGNLDVFRDAGFVCYRDRMAEATASRRGNIAKLVRTLDHLLALSTPETQAVEGLLSDGMVRYEPSVEFFDINRKLELGLDSLNLHRVRTRWMIKGLRQAAQERRIFHVISHPWNFQTEKDADKLRNLLEAVAEETARGRLVSVGMAELATAVLEHQSVAVAS